MYQERHGWERPGWFSFKETNLPKYDWYGAYETPINEDSDYKDKLNLDYTFGFPKFHENVSYSINYESFFVTFDELV